MNYERHLVDGRISIFLFHGVTHPHGCAIRNYTRKHVEMDYFAKLIRQLKTSGTAISMDQVLQFHNSNEELPPNPFAITFDDGFENNLSVASPILDDEKVPATFYITTDFVDSNRMGWIDRIEFAMEIRPHGRLSMPWGVREFNCDQARRELLSDIRMRVKRDRQIDNDALASDIQDQLGVPITFSSDHVLDRKLNWDNVKALARNPLFIVAGHSHTHRILEYLNDDELDAEIDTSLELLKNRGGIVSSHYSYPEGMSYCYSDRVITSLQKRGICCCPSAEEGTNLPPLDLFRLKRIMVT